MAKEKCPIEKYILGYDKCPFQKMCTSKYKKVCKYNHKLIKNFKIKIKV